MDHVFLKEGDPVGGSSKTLCLGALFIRCIALLSINFVLLAPEYVAAQGMNEWKYSCKELGKTGKVFCGLFFNVILPDVEPQIHATLVFLDGGDEDLSFSVFTTLVNGGNWQNRLCWGSETSISVDGAPVIPLNATDAHFSHYVDAVSAREVADIFQTGKIAVLTVHNVPECRPREVRIPLEDFPAAWQKLIE